MSKNNTTTWDWCSDWPQPLIYFLQKKKIEKTFAILNAQRRQEAQSHASVLLKVKFAIARRLPAAELPLCLTKCGGPAAEIC